MAQRTKMNVVTDLIKKKSRRSVLGTSVHQLEIDREKQMKLHRVPCVMHRCVGASACEHQCSYLRLGLIKRARTNESATNSTHDDPTNGLPRIVNNIVELDGADYVSE